MVRTHSPASAAARDSCSRVWFYRSPAAPEKQDTAGVEQALEKVGVGRLPAPVSAAMRCAARMVFGPVAVEAARCFGTRRR